MKKYVLAVLVVMFVGVLVSSCGGKGFKGVKNAARDLRNSVKSQLTGKGGKTVSSGPLFGRRAYSIPPTPEPGSETRTVKLPVALVALSDGSGHLWPAPVNHDVHGYYASLFSQQGEGTWRDYVSPPDKKWLGSGEFSMRDFYYHNSFGIFRVNGDIITAGPQSTSIQPDYAWLGLPYKYKYDPNQEITIDYQSIAQVAYNGQQIDYDHSGSLIKAAGYFASGENLDINGDDVHRLVAFLDYIVDWLNDQWTGTYYGTDINGNPLTKPNKPYLNRLDDFLSPGRDFPDSNDGSTFDTTDAYIPPGDPNNPQWTNPFGDRTPYQPSVPFFADPNERTWLDNFDWFKVFQDTSAAVKVFDHLTIVVAGPHTGERVRELCIPINQDWNVHKLRFYSGDNLVEKQLGNVTVLFEKEYNPYLLCHEFGHVIGLPDLYDTRNGLFQAGSHGTSIVGDNGIGNKSLMGDEVLLNVPDSATRYDGSDTALDPWYGMTSVANDLDCYSRYVCGWLTWEHNNVHTLTPLATVDNCYNLAPDRSLLQVPIPLINNGGHCYAIPMVQWWLQPDVNPTEVFAPPRGFGHSWYIVWGSGMDVWPEWLFLENRGPSSLGDGSEKYDRFLDANSFDTAATNPRTDTFSGLLAWHLDIAAGYAYSPATLGILSAYNMGAVPSYDGLDKPDAPANFKFLRLLEADGAKANITGTPQQNVLARHVPPNPLDHTTIDPHFGDKWDMWAFTDTGAPDSAQLPFLSPYHQSLDWWNQNMGTESDYKYVNTECNNWDPENPNSEISTTGLFIRNFRKGNAGNTVYVYGPSDLHVYPTTSGWPTPDDTNSANRMVFVDIFRLPRIHKEAHNPVNYLRCVNGVRMISISQSTTPRGESAADINVYYANSSDIPNGTLVLYWKPAGSTNWIPATGVTVTPTPLSGHGVAHLTWLVDQAAKGIALDLRVALNLHVAYPNGDSDDITGDDVLSKYFMSIVIS
jgi:hypothetical protein